MSDSLVQTQYDLSLPGVDLEPGFCVRLRALITSTSNWPFLSSIPICMSPASGGETNVSASLQLHAVKKQRYVIIDSKL